MYPELIRIGPIVIASYGILLAVAFLIGIYISLRLARRRGLAEDHIYNLAFVVMISAILGSRLLYVLFHLEEFQGRWQYTILPIQPDGTIGLSGLVLLGGVLGALLSGTIYLRIKGEPIWPYTDSIAPALALGIGLGRIGCFLNGCCFGLACELPWGVRFPADSIPSGIAGGHAIHPTQLYSALIGFSIFLALVFLEKRGPASGLLSALFLILYGLGRVVVDVFRYYETQMYLIGGLGLNQLIGLGMIFGGVLILLLIRRNLIRAQVTSQ